MSCAQALSGLSHTDIQHGQAHQDIRPSAYRALYCPPRETLRIASAWKGEQCLLTSCSSSPDAAQQTLHTARVTDPVGLPDMLTHSFIRLYFGCLSGKWVNLWAEMGGLPYSRDLTREVAIPLSSFCPSVLVMSTGPRQTMALWESRVFTFNPTLLTYKIGKARGLRRQR